MPRVICVWFPNWPIQRLRNERPELREATRSARRRLGARRVVAGPTEIILHGIQSQRPVVTHCTPGAERRGVRAGLSPSEARALVPRAVFLPADEAADVAALRNLALECQRFSPLVGLEEGSRPESLLAHVEGCTHLWGGEAAFLEHVRAYWEDRGLEVHLALADSVGAAWAMTRSSRFSVVPAGEAAAALGGLPVEALRLPPDVIDRLRTLGLDTIGEILSLPRESLASRFGTLLPRRLDQALGLSSEPFVSERLVEPLCVFREWETPIDDRLALVELCHRMFGELLVMANRHGMGLHELEGEIRTEGGPVTLAIRLSEPTRDATHLEKLLELQLERQRWSGGVTSVCWTALRLGRVEESQGRWFEDEREPDRSRTLGALVDRLSSRLETGAVLRVEVLPDAQPECLARLVPWMSAGANTTDSCVLPPEISRGRPLRLLATPLPVDVSSILPDGPPIHLVWRGQDHPVIRAWGPERIATGWWRGPDVERDYYRAEWDDGTHAWLYRDRRADRWFLHGFFD